MAETTVVTDEDGNEYEVEQSALKKFKKSFDIMGLPEHAESVVEITHRPTHTGYDYVARVAFSETAAHHVFDQPDMFGMSEMGQWLSEHGVELDIRCIEMASSTHSYELNVYFYVDE